MSRHARRSISWAPREPARHSAWRKSPRSNRDRYGATPFGQSVLLARRLVEAGVRLVQVNWYRGPDEPPANPCWDSHTKESARLKEVLVPPTDRAYSALIEDLDRRGLLDETLVVCMAEFGRTPRLDGNGGRNHWGSVFSVTLAGGGVRGGQVYGASDRIGAYPADGRVRPEDLSATIFHCLGYRPADRVPGPARPAAPDQPGRSPPRHLVKTLQEEAELRGCTRRISALKRRERKARGCQPRDHRQRPGRNGDSRRGIGSGFDRWQVLDHRAASDSEV